MLESMGGLLPTDALTLVTDYTDRTLRTASAGTLLFGELGALWLGPDASISITKAANLSYGPREGRPFWRLRDGCLMITFGFALLVAVLTLAIFNLVAYASRVVDLPGSTATENIDPQSQTRDVSPVAWAV